MASANIPMYYEFRRLQESEQRLQEENRILKRQLEIFVAAQSDLKKEQVEVTKIKKSTAAKAMHAEHLRKDLEESKGQLKKGHEQWSLEREELQMTLANEFIEFENVFKVQRSRIQELQANEIYAFRKMKELSQKIEALDVEKKALNDKYHTVSGNMVMFRSKAKQLFATQKEQVDKLTKHKRQEDAYKAEIHQMTMQINALKIKIETDTLSNKALEDVVDQLNENEIHLKMELENEKKETEKQHHLIMKLQTEERELTQRRASTDEEILSLRSLNCESENKQRLLIIQTEDLTAERDLASQNLFRVQEELNDNKTATQILQEEVRTYNLEADEENNIVLAKAKRDYCGVKKQLEKVQLELAEAKNMHETFKNKQDLLESLKLNQIAAEKAELEKVMLHRNETVALLEEKKAEVECLTSQLAQLPGDTTLKLQKCQWNIRDLNKQLMAVKGNSMMYESMYTSVEKTNKELTVDLRKLKLKLGHQIALPPTSKRNQPPTEDKSKDECKPALSHTRFPLIKSEECLPVTRRPSIHKVQCCGVKITPHPPPPPSPRSQMGHSQRKNSTELQCGPGFTTSMSLGPH